jgi:DNA-directed RNA polymerase specialized sigma24 family protein
MVSMPRDARKFVTTHWTLVLSARDESSPDGRQALEELCRTYWYPLYAFLRRQGYDADKAQDLTQGFFARLLEKRYLDDVRPERGRFRTFLLTSLKPSSEGAAYASFRSRSRLPRASTRSSPATT